MPWYTTEDARRDAERIETRCMMLLAELPDLSDAWECSKCETIFKATKKFEKLEQCPNCGSGITEWESYEET